MGRGDAAQPSVPSPARWEACSATAACNCRKAPRWKFALIVHYKSPGTNLRGLTAAFLALVISGLCVLSESCPLSDCHLERNRMIRLRIILRSRKTRLCLDLPKGFPRLAPTGVDQTNETRPGSHLPRSLRPGVQISRASSADFALEWHRPQVGGDRLLLSPAGLRLQKPQAQAGRVSRERQR